MLLKKVKNLSAPTHQSAPRLEPFSKVARQENDVDIFNLLVDARLIFHHP